MGRCSRLGNDAVLDGEAVFFFHFADGGDEGFRRRVEYAGLERQEEVGLEAVPVDLAGVHDAAFYRHALYVEGQGVADLEAHALGKVLFNRNAGQLG